MPRFFVTRSQVAGDEIVIRGNDVNHIKNVLRMHPGDRTFNKRRSGDGLFLPD